MTGNMKVQEDAASADIWSWNLMKSWGKKIVRNQTTPFWSWNLMKSWGKKIVRNQTTPFWIWILQLNQEEVKFWTP